MVEISADIRVVYKSRDGWTLYTSPELPGLFVSSQDDRAAYEDLPAAIKLLIELELGVSVSVSHKGTYEAFRQEITLGDRAWREVQSYTDDIFPGQTIPFIVTNSIRSHEHQQ